jgi:hypothetical protein
MYSSSWTFPDGIYTLTAVPNLLDTEVGNQVSSLIFIATDGYDSHTWTVLNQGRFIADFSLLMDAGTAYRLFQGLRNGKNVTFPGTFNLEFPENASRRMNRSSSLLAVRNEWSQSKITRRMSDD